MSKIYILSFTNKGSILAKELEENILGYKAETIRVKSLGEVIERIFKKNNVIVFIGAVGIAVRAIADFVEHKTKDPAVIVIDELGRFVIPILSGHIGGANQFSYKFAEILGATPVITTATDINNVFSIDTFGQTNGYYIENPENIKHVSANLLEKKSTYIKSEFPIMGQLPENIYESTSGNIGIYIGLGKQSYFEKALILRPRLYHVGIGCKKDISFVNMEEFFIEQLEKLGVNINLVASISSIDIKSEELCILQLCEKYNIPFYTYPKEKLCAYEDLFPKSDFVKDIVGVSSVCETAAYCTSKEGEMILNKFSYNGMTIAIAKENWIVNFKEVK